MFVKFMKLSWFFLQNDQADAGLLTESEIKEGVKNNKLPVKVTKEEKEQFLLLL